MRQLHKQQQVLQRTPGKCYSAAAPHGPVSRRMRKYLASAVAFDSCTVAAVALNVSDGNLYEVGQFVNSLVQQELTDVSFTTCGAVLVAGLLTSVSPCTLSVLPLTIGYIAGYADPTQQQQPPQQQQQLQRQQKQQPESDSCHGSGLTPQQPLQQQQGQQQHAGCHESRPAGGTDNSSSSSSTGSRSTSATTTTTISSSSSTGSRSTSATNTTTISSSSLSVQAACFSLGLASSLAALGVVSSSLGRAYGQIGSGLPSAVALVAIVMGLNLLEVVRVPLPSLFASVDVRSAGLPPQLTAYAAGALFALAASPCSTPVLASILAYASTQESPLAGGLLLFLYSCGYVAPLLVAATATGAAKRLLEFRQYSAWVTPASGVLLVSGGTYALLTRVLPTM